MLLSLSFCGWVGSGSAAAFASWFHQELVDDDDDDDDVSPLFVVAVSSTTTTAAAVSSSLVVSALSLVGKIAVTSEPAGARVMVGPDFVGITNFFPVDVHTGAHKVEISLEGYESVVYEDVNILPGEVVTLEVTLFRNSAKLPVITQPGDVEVWVDELRATDVRKDPGMAMRVETKLELADLLKYNAMGSVT